MLVQFCQFRTKWRQCACKLTPLLYNLMSSSSRCVRDLFQRHIIGVEYVNTDDMPADIFTKPLPFDAFTKHRATLLNA